MSEASEKISEAVRRLGATVAASDVFTKNWQMRPTAYPGESISRDLIEDIRALLAERTEMEEALRAGVKCARGHYSFFDEVALAWAKEAEKLLPPGSCDALPPPPEPV